MTVRSTEPEQKTWLRFPQARWIAFEKVFARWRWKTQPPRFGANGIGRSRHVEALLNDFGVNACEPPEDQPDRVADRPAIWTGLSEWSVVRRLET
jgi:hypothetical protein